MQFRIGCSGWSYAHWRESFYPKGVPSGRWLEHYCTQFDTVELNASFYRLPAEITVQGWVRRTPEGFVLAAKASRLITHYQRLADCQDALDAFFGRIRGLGVRLGPILFQLPPGLQRDDDLLEGFLDLLPADLLHVFEFRHRSWWEEPVLDLLRAAGAAFCIYNMGQVTTPKVATCPDAYVRLHGPGAGYASAYSDEEIATWARDLESLPSGVERAWVYFNNDVGGHAPRDAARLQALLQPE